MVQVRFHANDRSIRTSPCPGTDTTTHTCRSVRHLCIHSGRLGVRQDQSALFPRGIRRGLRLLHQV